MSINNLSKPKRVESPNGPSSPTPPQDAAIATNATAAFGAAPLLGRVWQWLKEAAMESGGPPCGNRNRGRY